MESEITINEAFKYVLGPGVLSLSERSMILSFQKYYKLHKTLSERQLRTLMDLRTYRVHSEKHLY
jgi:hypothetical protein